MSHSPLRRALIRFRDARRSRRARKRAALIPSSTPVFVHSHGKVGSSTVSAILRQIVGDEDPVFHTHVLSEEGRDKARRKYAASRRGGPEAHLVLSDAIAPYLEALPFACRIITPTREPVGRAISHAFQTMRSWAPPDAQTMDREALVRLTIDQVDSLLSPDTNVSNPSHWFDTELRGVFGIDAFAQPYDFDKGYVLLENGPIQALVIRMEDLDRSLAPALAEMTGRPVPGVLRNTNVGSAKWYGPVIKEVKKRYRPSPEQIERVLGGRYYQHFYADAPEQA